MFPFAHCLLAHATAPSGGVAYIPTVFTPTRVGSAGAAATTVTLPTTQVGDLIIMLAIRNGSNTAPTVPAGWTTINRVTGANTFSSALAYKVAVGSDTSGTWTNATDLVCEVWRGSYGIGASAVSNGSSATASFPALTLQKTDGSSMVAGFGGCGAATFGGAPGGMQTQTSAGTGPEAYVADTNGGVTSWSAQTVTLSASVAWRAHTVEVLGPKAVTLSAGANTFTTPGVYYALIPGAGSISGQAWGGGGSGNFNYLGGAGGGFGETDNLSATANAAVFFVVGAGGAQVSNAAGNPGKSSWVNLGANNVPANATTGCLGAYGPGATGSSSGATALAATSSIGSVTFHGGNGYGTGSFGGGNGGGGAGSQGNGVNASSSGVGAGGAPDGGSGGSPGAQPGGGGGGTNSTGSAGGAGQVRITFTPLTWTPDLVSSVIGYYDPSGVKSAVTLSGGYVTALTGAPSGAPSLSVSANGMSANGPALEAVGITSLKTLLSSSTDNRYNMLGVPYTIPQGGPRSAVFVFRTSDLNNNGVYGGGLIGWDNGGAYTNGCAINIQNGLLCFGQTGQTPMLSTSTSVADGNTHVVSLVMTDVSLGNATCSMWLDGTLIGTNTAYSWANNGGVILVGRCCTSTGYAFAGEIGGVALFNDVLSDADRQKSEGSFAWLWGSHGLLPTNHPYYSAAPPPA